MTDPLETEVARDEARSDWIALVDKQADLAAMREALERIKREAGANMAGDSVSVAEEAFRMLDRIEEWATVALAASPGAGWLVTAREVVEALKSTSWKNLDGACWCRGPAISGSGHRSVCVNMRALLARPEVQRWAGR